MSEIPFETIKQRAKCALDARIARCDPTYGATGFDGDRAGRMLIPYVLLDDEARAPDRPPSYRPLGRALRGAPDRAPSGMRDGTPATRHHRLPSGRWDR